MGSPAPTTRAARPAPCAAAAAQPGCGPAERARPSDCPASPHGHRSVAYKCELPVASTVPLKASRSKMRDNFRAEGKVARVCMRGSNDLATGVGHSARTLDTRSQRVRSQTYAVHSVRRTHETRHDTTTKKPDCCLKTRLPSETTRVRAQLCSSAPPQTAAPTQRIWICEGRARLRWAAAHVSTRRRESSMAATSD